MLAELLRYFRLRCPPWARSLGLAYEHVAITARQRRVSSAWAPHLRASKETILQAARLCRDHRRALVIGAGDGNDVPVSELTAQFDEVLLTDVVLGPELRRLAASSGGKVRAEILDATGALAILARQRRTLTPAEVETIFENAHLGLPPGGEPDLVVSANCISQLGVVSTSRFSAPADGSDWETRWAAAATRRHLGWLAARPGTRVLLGDRARLDIARDGKELQREPVPGMNDLRAPDRQWRWDIAPIPEHSPDFHRIHEVGAWIDA